MDVGKLKMSNFFYDCGITIEPRDSGGVYDKIAFTPKGEFQKFRFIDSLWGFGVK